MLAAPCLLALVSAAAADALHAEYRDLVGRYARGERGLAVAGLARFTDAERSRAAQAAERAVRAGERGTAAVPPFPLRAAAMLHIDLDEAEWPEWVGQEQPARCPGKQAAIAARYAVLLAGHAETQDFARRFFAALALRSQWNACLPEAQRWAREGLRLFPRDAPLLLAAGCAFEEAATVWGASTVLRADMSPAYREAARRAAAERDGLYAQARGFFEAAIAADGTLALARVHLGRVWWRLGERAAAQAALEHVVARSTERPLLYLAHLFLGRVHEDSERLEEAMAHYRRALELDPDAQTAAVALSHALRLTDQGEESRAVLRHALARAGRRRTRDAYWEYLVVNAVGRDEMFAALREESLE
jgi:tetratricopeptide (TPR) repeat protein